MKKRKFMLIHTNGYEIDTEIYGSEAKAERALRERYKQFYPEDMEYEWEDMSFCEDNYAVLYCNGEDVHVWKAVPLTSGTFLFIQSDGYSIETTEYANQDEAVDTMNNEYTEYCPDSSDEWDDVSYCGETEAIAYDGNNVYVWNIIPID